MNKQQLEQQFLEYFSQSFGLFRPKPFKQLGIDCDVKTYQKGQNLIEQGQPAPHMFFVASGLVRYVCTSANGKEFSKYFLTGPGLVGSSRSMLRKQHSYFSIEALEPTLCLRIEWDDFYRNMKPQEGFMETYTAMIESLFLMKEEREASFVLQDAEQRYLQFVNSHPDFLGRIPLQHIASYIGITPVALSRIRKRLG